MALLMVFEAICLYYQLRRLQSTNNRDCFVAFGLSIIRRIRAIRGQNSGRKNDFNHG